LEAAVARARLSEFDVELFDITDQDVATARADRLVEATHPAVLSDES